MKKAYCVQEPTKVLVAAKSRHLSFVIDEGFEAAMIDLSRVTSFFHVLNTKRSLMLTINSLRSDINLLTGALHNIL
ncbi:hypothetical protein DICVIV_01842 [Dictyocaulus viviparus]|uniref:Uncharacterized protein n=1 Tax=Dictyocaulus viviparus TaxID=29172 RepID=A0A0D8YBL4_DICVI|nr:hypothetical protein DICVIV_01842 [Dictyocaulus viviparus]